MKTDQRILERRKRIPAEVKVMVDKIFNESAQKEADEMLKNPLTFEQAKAQVERLNNDNWHNEQPY